MYRITDIPNRSGTATKYNIHSGPASIIIAIASYITWTDYLCHYTAMATRSLDELEDFVCEKIEQEHMTHGKLIEMLCSRYPGVRSFSIRSIERFCQEKGIHKTSRLSQDDIKDVVAAGVTKV